MIQVKRNKQGSKLIVLVAVVILLLCSVRASAQSAAGQVEGTVTDPSSAEIPQASVTLMNEDSKVTVVPRSIKMGALFLPV